MSLGRLLLRIRFVLRFTHIKKARTVRYEETERPFIIVSQPSLKSEKIRTTSDSDFLDYIRAHEDKNLPLFLSRSSSLEEISKERNVS